MTPISGYQWTISRFTIRKRVGVLTCDLGEACEPNGSLNRRQSTDNGAIWPRIRDATFALHSARINLLPAASNPRHAEQQ